MPIIFFQRNHTRRANTHGSRTSGPFYKLRAASLSQLLKKITNSKSTNMFLGREQKLQKGVFSWYLLRSFLFNQCFEFLLVFRGYFVSFPMSLFMKCLTGFLNKNEHTYMLRGHLAQVLFRKLYTQWKLVT